MDLHCYMPYLEESQGAIVPQSKGPVTKRVCVGVPGGSFPPKHRGSREHDIYLRNLI